MSDFTDRNAKPAMSEKMAAFCRIWTAQYGRLPADWSRRQDPASTWPVWQKLIEDNRTQLGTCEVILAKFPDAPPPFNRFRSLYFDTITDRSDRTCSLCNGFRYLYAVTGEGIRRDGRRGSVLTGPGHKVVPVTGAAITTVICRCHSQSGEEKTGEWFGTSDRRVAEQHAAECEALAKQGHTAPVDPYAWAMNNDGEDAI